MAACIDREVRAEKEKMRIIRNGRNKFNTNPKDVSGREGERRERERESVFVCVCEREREIECVCVRERERVCV